MAPPAASSASTRRATRRARLAWRRLARLLERSVAEFFDDGCSQRAAALSYYSLLAIFPLAILTVAAFGLVVSGTSARTGVVDFLLDHLPLRSGAGRSQLEQLLLGVTQNTGPMTAVGAVGLIFSASGLMGSIRHALNAAWDRGDDGRPPVQGKAIDVLLVLGAGVFVVGSLALSVVLRFAVQVGTRSGGAPGQIAAAVLAAGPLVPICLSFAAFAFLYRTVPTGDVRLRDVWPGALLAALGYELVKTGFGFYLANFGHYAAIYGSIGAVIAFLVFALLAANVFLLGAEAASEWPGIRGASLDELEDDGDDGGGLRAQLRGLVLRPRRRDSGA